MTRTLLIAALVVALFPGEGRAGALGMSDRIRNPSAPLVSVHAEAVIPIVDQMGLAYEGATLPRGERALLVEGPDGHRFQVTPVACSGPNRCRGLHFLALFDSDADRRTVAAFGERYAFVSTGVTRDGLAFLSRYEIADYGIARGNLGIVLETFIETARLFEGQLLSAPANLIQAPQASDLSAHGLNLRGMMLKAGLPVEAVAEPLPVHRHSLGFEATADIVETFARAEAVYPGRIVNRRP